MFISYWWEGHAAARVMKIWQHLSYMSLAWSITVEELDGGPAWENTEVFQDNNKENHSMKRTK